MSVPVKAFTANDTAGEVHLNQLHKDCNSRVRYQKVCPEHGELKSEAIVSGFEHQKDSYVVVDPAELDKLRTKADRSVSIDGFIPKDAVDSRYFAGKAHYLLPDGPAGARPYALLREGMQRGDVVAIAQVVMAGREQLVLLRPLGRLLVMTGLHYPQRVRAVDEFEAEVEELAFKPEEVALTDTLIGASKLASFLSATGARGRVRSRASDRRGAAPIVAVARAADAGAERAAVRFAAAPVRGQVGRGARGELHRRRHAAHARSAPPRPRHPLSGARLP
ncbi:MAG: hypothetical protein K8J09_06365, partial [Planctomycetes bacterium]|nr:hypothetical protein [Planctomycetota bacterium]